MKVIKVPVVNVAAIFEKAAGHKLPVNRVYVSLKRRTVPKEPVNE